MKRINIIDRRGKLPIATMRTCFESMVAATEPLDGAPLQTVERNGVFRHYADPETDLLWVGFALGMRMAERIQNAEACKPPFSPLPSVKS